MTNPRTAARVVGALILISYVAVFSGAALMAPALDTAVPLADLDGQHSRLVLGSLGEFINDIAVVGIAVLLFPFLKRAGEGVALWYVGLRIFEGGLYMVGTASVLAISPLAERAVKSPSDAESLESVRAGAIGLFEGAGVMATVAFIVAALMLYVLLFRSRIVPRFIAIWGLIAVPLVALVNVIAPDITDVSGPVILLILPIVTNELFLAGWLLVKGIRVPEAVAGDALAKGVA